MADPDNWPSEHSEYFPTRVDFHSRKPTERLRALWRATTAHDSRRSLRRLLDDHPVDVAHVFNAYHYLGSTVLLELARRNIPVVLSLHDYKIACPNAILFSERTLRPCTVCLDRPLGFAWAPPTVRCRSGSVGAGLALSAEAIATHVHRLWRRVPTVVTVLNALQQRAAEHAGIAPETIHRVPNPVALADVTGVTSPARAREVLFVGRLTPLKGVDVLIRACADARLPLRVLGDGAARADLEALARALGAEVSFAGEVEPTAVAAAMAGAGVLAVPSLSPDVAPLVVTEAWGRGLPVVGSEIGGIADFLADGRGVLCPPGDAPALGAALRSLLDDPGQGAAMVARGRAFAARELSRDRWIERLEHIYGTVGTPL
jgi:glycosyltransferase involved in cell wall biosynthesis